MTATLAWIGLLAASAAAQAAPPATPNEDYLRFDLFRHHERVEADGTVLQTTEQRVLLRNAAAVGAFGQLGSSYIDGFGEVSFEAVTIEKPDGRQVEVQGQVEDVNPFGLTGMPVAADLRFRKLTVPGLEPGDTLSFRIVHRERPLAPGRIFGATKLGPLVGDPVQVYELDLPRDSAIRLRLREGLGASWEEVSGPADRRLRRLSLRVPQARPGEDGFTKAELLELAEPDVLYSSFGSWPDVTRWWWELSRARLLPDEKVKAEAARLTLGKATAREKLLALHGFVAANIRYLSVSFGVGRMQPRPASDVLASRYGDCKDKHALLAALATAAGVDVRPVLVHSYRGDLRDDVPGPQQFDHMISVALLGEDPGQWLWLDATDALSVPGQLARGLRDKRALLIGPSGDATIVRTPSEPPFVPFHESELRGSLAADGVLSAHVVWKLRSDSEPPARFMLAVTPQDRRADLMRSGLARSWKNGKVTNVSTSDPADVGAPFRIEFDAERPAGEQASSTLWLPLADFELPMPREKVSAGEPRVEFSVRDLTARAEVELPEGVSAQAPLSVALKRPFGSFESKYAVEGRLLRVERTLRLSRSSLADDEVAAYEAFRKAIETDRDQEFSLSGAAPGELGPKVLHGQGKAAHDRKDYAAAAELLRKAAEADPKLKDVQYDLGRALHELGRHDEALVALGKQVEAEPFHEFAYAERAYCLIGLDRWEEAERDLLKQIEVAPFKAWSYEKLAERRAWQSRWHEAADYYRRAAAIEPKDADHWADLASMLQRDGRGPEAREALGRARALDPADWIKVSLARTYGALGDWEPAGELASLASEKLATRLVGRTETTFEEGDLYWSGRLFDAWYVMGAAAAAAGDSPKAGRYLRAAWKLGLHTEAGQRLAQADLGGEVAAAQEERTHRLGAASASFHDEVLLLVEADGRVSGVRNLTKRNVKGLDELLSRAGPIRLGLSAPDERPFKAVCRGVVACAPTSGCQLILDVPGAGRLAR